MIRIEFIGNLTKDPTTNTVNGKNVTNFSVAVNRRDRDGNDHPTYINVGAWGRLGEICDQYLAKGRKVYVEGIPSARGYQTRDGKNAASLDVMANQVEFVGGRNEQAAAASSEPSVTGTDQQTGFDEVEDEELPF